MHQIVKHTILCLLLTASCRLLTAQTNNFAPVGAKWWYGYNDGWFGSGYWILESVGDTLIEGVTCRRISVTEFIVDETIPFDDVDTFYLDDFYIYEDSGVVYNYLMDTFFVLYDYNAVVGSQWMVGGEYWDGCDTVGMVQVDSITTATINGFELKQMYTSSVDDDYWNFYTNPISERLGAFTFLYAVPIECFIDHEVNGPLRCYYDNEFGYYMVDSTVACDWVLNTENLTQSSDILVSPNPFSEIVHLTNIPINNYDYCSIFNAQGALIQTLSIETTTLDLNLSKLPSGCYILSLQGQNTITTQKIIKN